MIVSRREEALAKELYELEMSATPGGYVEWDKQISYVHTHYRRQASRVVKSRWLVEELASSRDRLDTDINDRT